MHKVLLLASKFYLINILGLMDSDMVFNYAVKNSYSIERKTSLMEFITNKYR